MDLTKITFVTGDGEGGPAATFAWEGTVPKTGSVLWAITAKMADGTGKRQLVYKIVDGVKSAHFGFDSEDNKQTNIDDDEGVNLTANTLTVDFLEPAVGDLSAGFTWTAHLNIEGQNADECSPA